MTYCGGIIVKSSALLFVSSVHGTTTHKSCYFHLSGHELWQHYSNINPTRCDVTQFILSGNCSTCFGWYHHPSPGVQTTVSTASGICQTVIAICRYRGRVGTGLSVLWVVYATHNTLKPVPTLPR